MLNRENNISPYKVVWMTVSSKGGAEKGYLVVSDMSRDGRVIPLLAQVLIEYQQGAQSSGAVYTYYAKALLDFLFTVCGVKDLQDTSLEHIEAFTIFLRDEESKKAHTIRQYSFLVDKIFDKLYSLGYIQPESTLISPTQRFWAIGMGSHKGGNYTFAGETMRKMIRRLNRNAPPSMKSYEKVYSATEYNIIRSNFSQLRDQCIFELMCQTGYRLSSALSIKKNIELLRKCIVSETHSKTGRLHEACIDVETRRHIETYIQTERAEAVRKAGHDCGFLFIISKGKNIGEPMNYHAFYRALHKAEQRVIEQYPEMAELRLFAHGCRATFLNNIFKVIKEKGIASQTTDADIMNSMDWSSMQSLDNYRDMRQSALFDAAGLYRDAMRKLGEENESDTKSAV